MEKAREMQNAGLNWLSQLFISKGIFPVRFSDEVIPLHWAWTSAEALMAFFESHEAPPKGSIEAVLDLLFEASVNCPLGGKLIPALGEFTLAESEGVVDSTARALLALSEIRYHMLRNGAYTIKTERYQNGITSAQIAHRIEELLVGLEKNADIHGSWGLFSGEPSRVDPTSHALIALIRCRDKPNAFNELIDSTVLWLRRTRIEGGWGSMEGSERPDPGNTALALCALALVLPITDESIIQGAEYLKSCVKRDKFEDVTDTLNISKVGMGSVINGICIPSAPRIIQALLACGVHPSDESIQKLITAIYNQSRQEDLQTESYVQLTGWGLDNDAISTWYTSIVVYACCDYLRYVEYAGNRIDDGERTFLVNRIESEMLKRYQDSHIVYWTKAFSQCRRVTYTTVWTAFGLSILLSLAIYLIGESYKNVFLQWLAVGLTIGAIIVILKLVLTYLKSIFNRRRWTQKEVISKNE